MELESAQGLLQGEGERRRDSETHKRGLSCEREKLTRMMEDARED